MEKGVLMHISSLPSDRGIGSFGEAAYRFVDLMRCSGLTLWQVLPLNVTSYGDSPYQSPSAFAGNPYFIDLDTLVEDGLLEKSELPVYTRGEIDYAALYKERYETLRLAYKRFVPDSDYVDFTNSREWLDDYALFMTIKGLQGDKGLDEWEEKYRLHDMQALAEVRKNYGGDINFHKFTQYCFYTQWLHLKKYANDNGISIIGDIPIYVAHDSADVWSAPQYFELDGNLNPTVVAGVPPDSFAEGGQLWGNPIYNWDAIEKNNYDFWVKRLNAASELYDIVRIDHFRGFESFYTVKAGSIDAKKGEWVKGPGMKLFDVIKKRCDVRIIAEDLGFLDDSVRQMVKESGYPSMKVLQFGLAEKSDSDYLPRNYPKNCIAYTGTHDNDTSYGWFNSLSMCKRLKVRLRLKKMKGSVVPAMIKSLFDSCADYVVVPMQDYLGLGSEARMNTPSTLGCNWKWALKELPEKII